MIERHYTGAELAELLSLNPETIRRHAAAGRLESVRVGNDRRYPESAVKAWLDKSREGAPVVSLASRRQTRPSATQEAS